MSEIILEGPVAFLEGSQSAVFFSSNNNVGVAAGAYKESEKTPVAIKKLINALNVAYWGEDNRFPQYIERMLKYCGIGKAALDWKMKALWGNGIVPCKITGYDESGAEQIEILDINKYKKIYSFINGRGAQRFWLEYLQDWVWYGNCFPEIILSNDTKTITSFVHQETNDCRYEQMDDNGKINSVFISKLWGMAKDLYQNFDDKKAILGLIENPQLIAEVDNKFVKKLDCIDMYNAVNSLTEIAAKKQNIAGLKSAILPVNYPSPNKPYYQLPAWDGARLSGWIDIVSKIPSMIKTLYEKAFRIKYHIQIPETYFERRYGIEIWQGMDEKKQLEARKKLLKEMDDFLSGNENAYKTFISFFDIDGHDKKEYGLVKIESIEDKVGLDKELMTTSAGNVEILIAMGIHPALFSAGMAGSMYQSGGGSGSDIREAKLVYDSMLNLERQVLLEPLYLVRDYNREVGGIKEWEEDIIFRFRDVQLVTLDQGSGTKKKLS